MKLTAVLRLTAHSWFPSAWRPRFNQIALATHFAGVTWLRYGLSVRSAKSVLPLASLGDRQLRERAFR